jgi:uncharacterized RDD family membrane protein YckC
MKLHKIHPVSDVVNKVIEVIDVDGIVRKISVDDIVKRIDVNNAVNRIDWNRVLSTIDWDTQLERIDLDRIIRKIDTNSILVRSSTGIFTTSLDSTRTQLVFLDLYLRIVTRCRFWQRQHRQRMFLPPRPGEADRHAMNFSSSYRRLGSVQQQQYSLDSDVLYPKGQANKAVAVQGRYCGFCSKAVAILVDTVCITLTFAMLFRMIEWGLILFLQASTEDASKKVDSLKENGSWYMLAIYCSFWFSYFFLMVGLTSRTIGMMLMGLHVVNHSRQSTCYNNSHILSVTMTQAFVRTCLLPLTLTVFPPLGLFGAFRRDGRMFHDYMANTGIIYLWDAKMAQLRRKAIQEQDDLDGITTSLSSMDEGTDELDRMMDNDDSVGSAGRGYYAQFHDSVQGMSSTSLGSDSTDVMANTPESASDEQGNCNQEVSLVREYQVQSPGRQADNDRRLVHVGSSSNVSDLTASYHTFPPRLNAIQQQQQQRSKQKKQRRRKRKGGHEGSCSSGKHEHANYRIQ